MGSRRLPLECDRCGGVVDWGDFPPNPEGGTEASITCSCDPEPLELGEAVELLIAAAKAHGFKGVTVSFSVPDGTEEPEIRVEHYSAGFPVTLDVTNVEQGKPSRVVEGEDY